VPKKQLLAESRGIVCVDCRERVARQSSRLIDGGDENLPPRETIVDGCEASCASTSFGLVAAALNSSAARRVMRIDTGN